MTDKDEISIAIQNRVARVRARGKADNEAIMELWLLLIIETIFKHLPDMTPEEQDVVRSFLAGTLDIPMTEWFN